MNWSLFTLRLRKLAAIITDPAYRRAYLRHRVAPAIEHRAVLQTLPFDLVVDAGANRGQFSLLCHHLRPGAQIIAFEPLPAPAAIFRSLFLGKANVTLHRVALAPRRGEMEINISRRDDSSSLLPISQAQVEHYPGTQKIGSCKVCVAPITDFISAAQLARRNLLKIDVQGYELQVLESGEALLPHFDWIYVECSFAPLYEGQALAQDVIDFLTKRGFALQGKHNFSYGRKGALLQADLLFARG